MVRNKQATVKTASKRKKSRREQSAHARNSRKIAQGGVAAVESTTESFRSTNRDLDLASPSVSASENARCDIMLGEQNSK